MGSRKRTAESISDEVEETPINNGTDSTPSKKSKNNDSASDIKPMERKKNRKALDKKRHRVASEPEAKNPKPKDVTVSALIVKTENELPKFHIDVFRELASSDASVRLAAVERLVTELLAVQKAYESVEDKSVFEDRLKLEASKDDGLNDCAPSLRYAVKRLIRGASSSRECARQGFTLGLSLLLTAIPSLKLDAVMKLVLDLLEVTSSMSGQEARDCLLGRLFTYGAITRSKRLIGEWNLDHSSSCIVDLTDAVIILASKKRYLQEPAISIMVDMIEQLPNEAITNGFLTSPNLNQWLKESTIATNPDSSIDAAPTASGSPDAVFLSLKLLQKLGSHHTSFAHILPSNPFSVEHLNTLSPSLKDSSFPLPRVHSLWPPLLHLLLPSLPSKNDFSLKKSKKHRKSDDQISLNLQNFCHVIIDNSLLPSSHDRKHLAFDVITLLLPRLTPSLIPFVISPKLTLCLMDALATTSSWLYKAAVQFLDHLRQWVEPDDSRKVSVILALQKHSNGRFDSVSRTRTVRPFVESFQTEAGCLLFVRSLMDTFVDAGDCNETKEADSDSLRVWIIDALPAILKHIDLPESSRLNVTKEVLKFLTVQGLFSASLGSEVTSFELQETFTWPKVPVSNSICKLCVEQIQSLLALVNKLDGFGRQEESDMASYFVCFISTLQSIPSVSLFRQLDADDKSVVEQLLAMVTRLSREERVRASAKIRSVRYLIVQLILQVDLQPKGVSGAASEVLICCEKAFFKKDEEEESSVLYIDVIVDCLLSLLPQSSSPLRQSVEQVFKSFCDEITTDGVRRMLRIVKRDLKPARRQVENTEDEVSDAEEDDLDDLVIEDEFDDEQGEDETNESDQNDVPDTAGSDMSDGELDDEAMFRMDNYLAQILKDKKSQTGGESASSQLVLFKLRVLSLIEIYLHENPGKPEVLNIYSTLSAIFVNPQSTAAGDQLLRRVRGILLKKIFKAKEIPTCGSEVVPTIVSILKKHLSLASKNPKRNKHSHSPQQKKLASFIQRQQMIVGLAKESTFWTLKVVDASELIDADIARIAEVFSDALVRYLETKKSCLKVGFFGEIFRRRPWVGQRVLGLLLDRICCTKFEFRRVEALELVAEVLKNDRSGDVVKSHVDKIACLVQTLVTKLPDKPSRLLEVKRFCVKLFQILRSAGFSEAVVAELDSDTVSACVSQYGDSLLDLRKDVIG